LQAEISAAEQIRNADEQQYARPTGTRRGRGSGQRRGMITRSQRLEIPNQPALNLTNSTTSNLNTSSQRVRNKYRLLSRAGGSNSTALYSIRALAQQNLNADQNILCDHLHLFFGGKANEWYWNFHKANPNFTWAKFCQEFRKKFEDIDTDMHIWESINSRRQGDK